MKDNLAPGSGPVHVSEPISKRGRDDLEDLAAVECELDNGKPWAAVFPETQQLYRDRVLEALSFVAPPNGGGLGALAQWQRELKEGAHGQCVADSSTWMRGAVFVAASWEALALLAERSQPPRADLAQYCYQRAVAIVQGTLHKKREAA